MAEIPARKHCSICTRWLIVSINFRPRGWYEDGSRPAYVSSECNSCHKRAQRQRHNPKITQEVTRIRRDEEFFVLHNKLNALDFRVWLEKRVQEIGPTNVAASVGASQRIISSFIEGRYRKRYKGEVREYQIKYVQLATVDKYAMALGYDWSDIYPHLYYMEREVVRQRLSKRGIKLSEPGSPFKDPLVDRTPPPRGLPDSTRSTDMSSKSLDHPSTETQDLQGI